MIKGMICRVSLRILSLLVGAFSLLVVPDALFVFGIHTETNAHLFELCASSIEEDVVVAYFLGISAIVCIILGIFFSIAFWLCADELKKEIYSKC